MRSTTAGELSLLHSVQRAEGYKVEAIRHSNGDVVDITDRIISGSYNFSADDPVAAADLDIEDVYTDYDTTASLNPLITTSSYNSPDSLLWENNEVKIYFGVNTMGSAVGASELKLVYHGVISDDITPSMTQGKRTISVHCRDLAKRIQDRFIVGEFVYGSDDGTAAVAVIQSILNDAFTADESSSEYKKLHVDATAYTNCDLVIYPIKVGNTNAWDAIHKVIMSSANDDIGFELRYKFLPAGDTSTKDNEGNTITISEDGFYLCLLQIDQSKTTADDSIDVATDVVEEEQLSIQGDTIRNSIYVRYNDRDTKEEMKIHRDDPTSIASYDRRDMVIGQDDVPFIDTLPEAFALAGVALNALKDVPATDKITTQFMYHVDPNDMLAITNGQLATGTTKMGVASIDCSFAPGGGVGQKQVCSTTITGTRDRITGQISDWLLMTGGGDPTLLLPPPIANGQGQSFWQYDANGNASTKTVLTVPVPANTQVDHYEWRYAIEDENVWREETTSGPMLVIMGLPPSKNLAWTARAKVIGGDR